MKTRHAEVPPSDEKWVKLPHRQPGDVQQGWTDTLTHNSFRNVGLHRSLVFRHEFEETGIDYRMARGSSWSVEDLLSSPKGRKTTWLGGHDMLSFLPLLSVRTMCCHHCYASHMALFHWIFRLCT